MEKSRFTNRHVLITGAARGIGLEIARHFAREGAVLSLLDNNENNLQKTVEELKAIAVEAYSYNINISNLQQVKEAISKAEAIQPIDVLINNAGIANETPFLEIEENDWKKIIDVNLTGMFFVAQTVCRLMAKRQKGVVVNMASKNGLDGEFGYAHYNSSKGGVIMLTKTMALELAHVGIRVNAVCPGYIETPMSKEIDPPEFTEAFVKQYIPLNRPGKPEEIAPIFLFLASDESSFMTGQTIIADGGQLAGQKPGITLLNKMKL
ncbi:SDR family NAD(P)-dependent oxidoreductase [Segetibacter aerophilus]|uniref:3-oxoacyl-[acyl-carrier-protein] reductase FabG n=1 Tax=Segetibacter aerophilus TaxID=670293 RepID=A0A512BJ32_9BACT|nr:SDR family NAD(P)-dependent oxidoreductase [Segetibacter aerophilus]GEO11885.1 3-oxoacyl-[acyl-carrier-protein] reductase FabG [Segetibacter aerophilus]